LSCAKSKAFLCCDNGVTKTTTATAQQKKKKKKKKKKQHRSATSQSGEGSPHSKGFASSVTEKDVRPAGMVPGVARRGAMLAGLFASMLSSLRSAGGWLRLGEHPHPASP
jgi:hypothetical protein